MRRLILLLFLRQIVHSSCPDGFELMIAGECRQLEPVHIKISDDQTTDAAISQCKSMQAQPVIIHNDEQQSYWTNQRNLPVNSYVILGLTCNTSSSHWMWADGSALDYKPAVGYNSGLNTNCKSGCAWLIGNTNGFWPMWCDTDIMTFDIYCTMQLHHPVPSADGCQNFEADTDDGVCYQVGATAESWNDAQMACLKVGANLASIHNSQENSFVRRLAVSQGAVNGVYLGATISGKGNNFGWIDGSAWDYSNYHSGFPIPGAGDCLFMDTSTSAGLWLNIPCTEELPIACARDPYFVTVNSVCSDGPWEEDKIITSPGFPFNASVPCDFFLVVDAGKKVEVEIVFLEANTCCDSLIINDGYVNGHIIATLSGESRNTTFSSTSNTMKVSWAPQGGVNVRGMAMKYRGV